ncbi:MAG: ABC transporter transmembrane domain-containing protein, partial [Candidatus Nanopelagicales bacterium]|nr:ABC transporter transmembrane domain-containing protein [Candidatus Nanopelagicales bacterium]
MSGHANWEAYRSFATNRPTRKGGVDGALVRRVFTYARPYRGVIAIYVVTLVFTSLLSVAQPLMIPRLVDQGILKGNAGVVTVMAVLIALLAVVDAGLGLVGRYFSSRIGEGLIFDLRTEVYDHVQRQSVAFFTRAQT